MVQTHLFTKQKQTHIVSRGCGCWSPVRMGEGRWTGSLGLSKCKLLHIAWIKQQGPAVSVQFNSVQSLSRVRFFATPWIAARQASLLSPSPGVHSDSHPSSPWCHPAISSWVIPFSSCPQSLPASESFPMSQLRMRWPKYWSFSVSIISSKEIPGLISFRMDWLDLLAVQGTY